MIASTYDIVNCGPRNRFSANGKLVHNSGRGVQLQNLKRSPPDMAANITQILRCEDVTMDQISTSIRGAIKAPPGQSLVVSDLSSIESRVAGWLTGCNRIMQTFANGRDTYKDLAMELFHVPYDQVTKAQRTFAKPAALGCQYMLGAKGLTAYAENYGVDLTEDEAAEHVDTYRTIYPELPRFWRWIKDSVMWVIKNGSPAAGFRLRIYLEGDFLFIDLPSGRRLNYFHPEIVLGKAPWDPDRMIEKFQFEGMDQYTQKWGQVTAHAGGLLENIVQALARDVLAVWLTRLDAEHYIIGSVHDEIITVADGWCAEHKLQEMNAAAAAPIDWAPGLQLTAAGYISERYRKD